MSNQTTTTQTVEREVDRESTPVLKLRNSRKPQVRWTDDTVDNEHMNKKKTKICCIYHPPDDDDHHCSSSSESESDDSDFEGEGDSGPNAYEKQPTYN